MLLGRVASHPVSAAPLRSTVQEFTATILYVRHIADDMISYIAVRPSVRRRRLRPYKVQTHFSIPDNTGRRLAA